MTTIRTAASPGDGSVRPWQRMAMSASLWTVGSQGVRYGLRLASNLLLTRLLFPEAFGLMALITACVQGLQMLSDVGIGLGIIQNRAGEDPRFLNTAWTIQVIRGSVLWALSALLSWPISILYAEPRLLLMLPVAGLTALLSGLTSTSIFTLNRRLSMRKLTTLELGSYVIGLAATVSLVLAWGSVWGLVIGSVVGPAARTILSHWLSEDAPNRFALDPAARRSLLRFGRWIFLSTMLTFLVNQGDRLVLGSFLSMEDLGRYTIAALLSGVVMEAVHLLGRRVLFPIYSRLGDEPPERLRQRVARVRLGILLCAMPPLWLLTVLGDWVVELLYDQRYADAGWMTRLLAGGSLVALTGYIGPVHLARGESFIGLIVVACRAVVMLSGMVIGGALAGAPGLIVAVAVARCVHFPLNIWVARRYGLWMWTYDVAAILLSALVLGAGVLWR